MLQEEAEPLESHFELNDTLYAKAQIPKTHDVYLWLGVRIAGPRSMCILIMKSNLALGQCHARLSYPGS